MNAMQALPDTPSYLFTALANSTILPIHRRFLRSMAADVGGKDGGMSRMPSAQYPIFLEPDTLLPRRPLRPRTRQRLTPSPRWEPGSALVPLVVAAPALLIAAILAAQSAPEALRLLAALNMPAALRAL